MEREETDDWEYIEPMICSPKNPRRSSLRSSVYRSRKLTIVFSVWEELFRYAGSLAQEGWRWAHDWLQYAVLCSTSTFAKRPTHQARRSERTNTYALDHNLTYGPVGLRIPFTYYCRDWSRSQGARWSGVIDSYQEEVREKRGPRRCWICTFGSCGRDGILEVGTKALRDDALYFITTIINSKTKGHSTLIWRMCEGGVVSLLWSVGPNPNKRISFILQLRCLCGQAGFRS